MSALNDHKITDMNIYLTRMQKSILDKMFFVDKVFEPFEYILDFGCANGELIKALQTMCGEYKYVGYDISKEMIESARKNVPQASFYSEWESIDIPFSRSLLNISSTLHEVYSYGTQQDVEQFWERVFESGFRYITLRDMMLSDADMRPADPTALCAVRENQAYASQLADYERVWGKIELQRDLVHYLMKYDYTNNWEREVRENYIPLSKEKLLAQIPSNYRVNYLQHTTLPYLAWHVEKDFGISLKTPTHVKIIVEKI